MGGTPPEDKEEGIEGLGELFKAMAKFRDENDLDPQFPLEISEVKTKGFGIKKGIGADMGDWVAVRPCAKECEGKTFLGIYLGDIAIGATSFVEKATQALVVVPHSNPAIYIPDLKRVVFGCESWWGKIDSPEDLQQITDQDIQNIWYVKALKEMSEKEEE